MADCELLQGCAFFNDRMSHVAGPSELFKDLYCRRDSSNCARYMIAKKLGMEAVPLDLAPNYVEMAREYIARSPLAEK